jgi:hypothetical protein
MIYEIGSRRARRTRGIEYKTGASPPDSPSQFVTMGKPSSETSSITLPEKPLDLKGFPAQIPHVDTDNVHVFLLGSTLI